MFRSISCISTVSCGPIVRGRGFGNRRNLSLISIHSTFPATLYRFQLQRESKLYDKNLRQDDGEVEDAVEVSRDGLVCPGITNTGAQVSLFHLRPLLRLTKFRTERSSCPTHTLCKN
jgi:hypothetical protein